MAAINVSPAASAILSDQAIAARSISPSAFDSATIGEIIIELKDVVYGPSSAEAVSADDYKL